MHLIRSLSLLLILALSPLVASAQFTGWDPAEQPRTRATDISHIEMHISFDQPAHKLIGTVLHTISILPQKGPVDSVMFDAVNMTVEKVWIESAKGQKSPCTFEKDSAKLRIHFGKAMAFNTPFKLGIQYWAQPKRGMYFIDPDTFYTKRPSQIWTQGEGEDNRNWLPTYDYPNDKTTTEMYVTVRADQKALSNGKLLGKDKNKDGTVTWHWKEEKPYSTYLIMLGVGNYDVVTDMWRGKEVNYWVYPGWASEAHRIFGLTPNMLEFFSTKTNFPYAWEKYAQIAIADFMYGGMENVSATTLNDYVMFDKRSGIDFNAEGLIAHELAHQWFGDVLTCRGWLHMWLNESFATYFEALFREHQDGEDEFQEEMQGAANAGIGVETSQGKRPIVATNAYSTNTYPRGAATLNMLRHIVGDTAWWQTIDHYMHKHQFQPVLTNDLMVAFQEATGQNLQWFFDEWVFKSGHPMFDVTYKYDAAAKQLTMDVAQTQSHDSLTGVFKTPIDIEFTMPDGSVRTRQVRMEDSTQSYTFDLPARPQMIIFDKGNSIIKELRFHKSADEWVYQLQHAKPAIERSEAAINLSPERTPKNAAALEALQRAVVEDTFWAVRQHALNSLIKYGDSTHNIGDALLRVAENDKRPDNRAIAVEALVAHFDATNAEHVLSKILERDSSYRVVGSALSALWMLDRTKAYMFAQQYLATSSPRDRMRQSAINILEMTKNKESLNKLVSLLNERDVPKWTRQGIMGSIASMTSVDSALVYHTLWNMTKNGNTEIAGTAINKLADIGNAMTMHELEVAERSRMDMKSTYDSALDRMRKRIGQ